MRLRVTVEDITVPHESPARVACIELVADGRYTVSPSGGVPTVWHRFRVLTSPAGVSLGKANVGVSPGVPLGKLELVRLAGRGLQTATTAPTQGVTSLEQMVDSL